MSAFKKFQEIEAWKTARKLTEQIYRVSDDGLLGKDFGLRDQMRRAAVSVMSNIAEGFESRTTKLSINFLGHAKGSAGEVRAHLYVALDCGHIDRSTFSHLHKLTESTARQIHRLIQYLETYPSKAKVKGHGARR